MWNGCEGLETRSGWLVVVVVVVRGEVLDGILEEAWKGLDGGMEVNSAVLYGGHGLEHGGDELSDGIAVSEMALA